MLNCCIVHKKNRMQLQSVAEKADGQAPKEIDSSGEEEFFDCEEESKEADENKPEGRNEKCGDLKLLLKPAEPLYVPVTQDPSPLTEDMLQEQIETLQQLGDNVEAQMKRAQIQSASLLSDMEAFKAANPGCCVEDFVRWHSPRDWEPGDGSDPRGQLSERMRVPGNIWRQIWDLARAIPVRRQKRLFDDTKEAEKVNSIRRPSQNMGDWGRGVGLKSEFRRPDLLKIVKIG